jgi:predicted metal-dependent hydrolase
VNYEINVQPQRRNNLVLRISPGTMDVLIPNWLHKDSPQVVRFIQTGIERFGESIPPKAEHPITRQQIMALVETWAERIGVSPKRIQMKTMYRKWGSCSRRGIITLDKAVYHLPMRLVEYLVCHELIHLLEFNHGEGFQNLMTQHMPDWHERKRELTGYTTFKK